MCFTGAMSEQTSPAGTVRERAREEMRRAIVDAGRARLATEGPAGLSLRAVARDVGMVSSAVYRYVPSRDALLTALIIDAYDALGLAAEQAEAGVDRADVTARWRAIGRGARDWAVAHPQEWALVFGSPVIGYAAPSDTIASATRIPALLVALLHDAREAGVRLPDGAVDDGLLQTIRPVAEFFGEEVPPETTVRGLMAWTWLTGSISHQLFGHRHDVVADDALFFDAELDRMADFLGLGARED